MTSINILKLREDAILPTRNNPTDAGMDLYALEQTFIPLGSTAILKTGIAIETPVGFVAKIEDRSGLAAKGLRTGAGVVDASYRGEIGVVLHNLTNSTGSIGQQRGYVVNKGDRIAQILIYKVETPSIKEVKELSNTDRGSKGFGSSGA